eukprot:scaffold28782_cov62-Isochrysis_galbana.AAC.1
MRHCPPPEGGRSHFDVAFCLNVLDRCKDPSRMLAQMHALLPPGGWLVVAVVLPPLQVRGQAKRLGESVGGGGEHAGG